MPQRGRERGMTDLRPASLGLAVLLGVLAAGQALPSPSGAQTTPAPQPGLVAWKCWPSESVISSAISAQLRCRPTCTPKKRPRLT